MRSLDPRLLREITPARRYVLATGALGVLTGVLVLAQAVLLALVVSAVVDGADVASQRRRLTALSVVVLGRVVVSWTQERYGERAATSVISALRQRVLGHVVALGPAAGETAQGATATAGLVTDELERLRPYLSRYLPQLLLTAVVTPMLLVVVLTQDLLSGVLIAVTLPLVPLFMALVGWMTQQASQRRLAAAQRFSTQVLDLLVGLPTLVTLGREIGPAQRVRELGEAHRQATNATLRSAFLSALVLELLTTLSVALVAVGIGLRLLAGSLDLQTALLVLVLAPEVYLPLRQVGTHFHASTDGITAVDQAFAVLELPLPADGDLPAPDLHGCSIEVRDVVVLHEGRAAAAPDGASLTLRPGTVTAVVGPSGSGKSTLAELVLRLRDPDDGTVHVVEPVGRRTSLADLQARTWWSQIAWLGQHPVLVPGTVRENALLFDGGAAGRGSGRAEPDGATLDRAAAAAGFTSVLAQLPQGWTTRIGRDGVGLSAGQRQRLALLRVLLSQAPLVVLDEPTAHLDAASEQVVSEVLKTLRDTGRTVLVMSHRTALAALADTVVELAAVSAPPHDDHEQVAR
ncbi:thiol reductant ABC exporter subunit CydD [Angustibacter sp. McL0619]|uniref:thiol reductant ABC exporter subunit CydD n=1 Tax=Angustibacter sp. McL0619 TaxID=3415676 RepID=UPI003CF63A77